MNRERISDMNRIRDLREKRGITQEELAGAIGKTHSTIARYELGNRRINVDTIRRMCDYFGCSMGYLMGLPETTASDDEAVIAAYHALNDRDRKIVDLIFQDYLV